MRFLIISFVAFSAQVFLATFASGADPYSTGLMNRHFGEISEEFEAAKSDKKIFAIYFWQEGCPYCEKLEKESLSSERVAKVFKNDFHIIEINIFGAKEIANFSGETGTEKEFAKSFKIQFTPTIIFFDDDGKEAFRLPGFWREGHLLGATHYVKKGFYKSKPFQEFIRYEWLLHEQERTKGGKK